MNTKSAEAFRTIGEVAEELDVPKHVLRFWEGKFPHVRPMKRGGGRRYYRPEDLDLLRGIRHLLHAEGYTIKGVQKILREQGIDQVKIIAQAAIEAAGDGKPPRRGRSAAVKSAPRARRAQATATSPSPAEPASSRAAATASTADAVVRAAIQELEACRAALRAGAPAEVTKRHRA